MYEDDKDKVRRNLMALSGFILVSYYLDLRLPSKVFDVDLPKEPNKIWVVVLVVLGYAFWRFIHSDEVRKARSSIASQYADHRIKVYDFLLFRDLSRAFHGKPSRWISILPAEQKIEHEGRNPSFQTVRLIGLAPKNTKRLPYKGFERLSGTTDLQVEFTTLYAEGVLQNSPETINVEKRHCESLGIVHTFKFPRWIEFFVTLVSFIIVLVRSEIIPEVLIPYSMAAAAGVITLIHVLR